MYGCWLEIRRLWSEEFLCVHISIGLNSEAERRLVPAKVFDSLFLLRTFPVGFSSGARVIVSCWDLNFPSCEGRRVNSRVHWASVLAFWVFALTAPCNFGYVASTDSEFLMFLVWFDLIFPFGLVSAGKKCRGSPTLFELSREQR